MRPHPASCCCETCLQEIEANFDGSQPYYVRYLVAALREERKAVLAMASHVEVAQEGWRRALELAVNASQQRVKEVA
jgi:hypothetical protein